MRMNKSIIRGLIKIIEIRSHSSLYNRKLPFYKFSSSLFYKEIILKIFHVGKWMCSEHIYIFQNSVTFLYHSPK